MSTLEVSNISDKTTSVPAGYVVNGSAKAWLNFDGTGTISTRSSLNISSLTDNSTGNYTINFSSSFNGDYSMLASGRELAAWVPFGGNYDASSFRIVSVNTSFTAADTDVLSSAAHGDLA